MPRRIERLEKRVAGALAANRGNDVVPEVERAIDDNEDDRGELYMLRAVLAHAARRHEDRHLFLSKARAWAHDRSDQRLEARVLAEMCLPLGRAMTHLERIQAGEQSLAISKRVRDPRLIARCTSNLAFAKVYGGERSALRMFPEAVRLLEGVVPERVSYACWDWAAAAFAFGDYSDAARAVARAEPFVDEGSHRIQDAYKALLHYRLGAWDRALERLAPAGRPYPSTAEFIPAIDAAIMAERQSRLQLIPLERQVRLLRTPLHWLPLSAAVLVRGRTLRGEPSPERGLDEMLSDILSSGRRVGWDELLVVCATVGGSLWEQALALLEHAPPAGIRAEGSRLMALGIRTGDPERAATLFIEAATAFGENGETYPEALAIKAAAGSKLLAGRRTGGLNRLAAEKLQSVGAWRSLAALLKTGRGTSALRGVRVPDAGRTSGAVGLTRREFEVANFAAEGLPSREIAHTLGISQRTVETHLENIKSKLGVRRKSDLIALARGRFEWEESGPPKNGSPSMEPDLPGGSGI